MGERPHRVTLECEVVRNGIVGLETILQNPKVKASFFSFEEQNDAFTPVPLLRFTAATKCSVVIRQGSSLVAGFEQGAASRIALYDASLTRPPLFVYQVLRAQPSYQNTPSPASSSVLISCVKNLSMFC